jgi:hypothetical protein
MNRRFPFAMMGFALLGCVLGCNGGTTADLKGNVTYSGKPVTGGTLNFAPAGAADKNNAGAPVSAPVGADGTYKAQNVVAGKVMVTYVPPPDDYPPGYTPKPSEPPPPSPFKGLSAKTREAEIKAGAATLDIELVNAKGK